MNVRHKVKELVEFVQDDDKLREERKKAKKNKDKYIGVSSDSMSYRGYRKSSATLVRQTHKNINPSSKMFSSQLGTGTNGAKIVESGTMTGTRVKGSFPSVRSWERSVTRSAAP